MADPMEFVNAFKVSGSQAVKEAYITPNTEMVSQAFGKLLIEHEELTNTLPEYLYGCIDAILADCLYHLHMVALYQRDREKATNDDLTKAIVAEMTRVRDEMKRRRNLPKEEKGCSCGKKGSCQSPIMEA